MKNKKTALIVDDEEIVLEIEEFMFQKIGFEILKDWPNGFLPKPFKFDEFTKSVDNILAKN